MPTKLRTAVAVSSVSPTAEIRMDRWKRRRNVQGVLEVHVDDLVGGGNLVSHKAAQWLRSEVKFGTWDQDLHFIVFSSHGARCCLQNKSKIIWTLQRKQTCTHNFVDVSVGFSGCNCRGFRCCHFPLESCIAGQLLPKNHDLLSLNKLMREARSMRDLCC